MPSPHPLDPLRLQADLRSRLREVADAHKALVAALRHTREAFACAEAAVAVRRPGQLAAELAFAAPTAPPGSPWDLDMLSLFLAGQRPRIPSDTILAAVQRRGRRWAVLALRDPRLQFGPDHRRTLVAVAEVLTEIVAAIDAKHLHAVRRRIEESMASREGPADILYEILHGLRSLTRYDHSAALLFMSEEGRLRLVAEQIAWAKAKSKRIGTYLAVDATALRELDVGQVRRYSRASATTWTNARTQEPAGLPALLTAGAPVPNAPPEVDMICAVMTTPDRAVAVLKISAQQAGLLGDYEAGLVEELVPLASIAIQFSLRTQSLRERILKAERKHALVDLTRGIGHDVNNALGAMLPLVQQLQQEAHAGTLRAETVAQDLGVVEKSIQTCRRIFGGMLAVARGANPALGQGNVRRALAEALILLDDSLKRRAVQVQLELPAELPAVRGGQGDLTQLFLNLCSNARDAMPNGGLLRITGANLPDTVTITISDNGVGIPREILGRIAEPFFTTKEEGNGLGLSICRSILWDLGGDMDIDSTEGQGTTLTLRFPVLQERTREATP